MFRVRFATVKYVVSHLFELVFGLTCLICRGRLYVTLAYFKKHMEVPVGA